MKICWDDLEGINYTKRGNFVKQGKKYLMYLVYKDSCLYCGNPYFTKKKDPSKFCSNSCANSGINNYNYGKSVNDDSKQKVSIANFGENNVNWKGGVSKLNLPLFSTYANKLSYVEDVRKFIDKKDRPLLQVRCSKCKSWFVPLRSEVKSRIRALNGKTYGENRFYCSKECKDNCEVFNKKSHYYIVINEKNEQLYTDYEQS
jgi:hypothetical protein